MLQPFIIMRTKLVTRFGEQPPSGSSVTNWLRRIRFGGDIFGLGIHSGKPSDGFVSLKILAELTAFSFHRVQTLAGTLKIPRSAISAHLQKGLCVLKRLRWVPDRVGHGSHKVWVTPAESLSKNLRSTGTRVDGTA
jgi:hypothetical protein